MKGADWYSDSFIAEMLMRFGPFTVPHSFVFAYDPEYEEVVSFFREHPEHVRKPWSADGAAQALFIQLGVMNIRYAMNTHGRYGAAGMISNLNSGKYRDSFELINE